MPKEPTELDDEMAQLKLNADEGSHVRLQRLCRPLNYAEWIPENLDFSTVCEPSGRLRSA
jgi:hypothetical protein